MTTATLSSKGQLTLPKSIRDRLRLPADAVPDVIPGIGYVDDMSVLAAALVTLAQYVDEVKDQARRQFMLYNVFHTIRQMCCYRQQSAKAAESNGIDDLISDFWCSDSRSC